VKEELETDRLVLRMFRESDTDAYADMVGDPEVMRFLGGKPMSRQEAWRNMAMVLGHWQLRGYGFWAVEEKSTGEISVGAGFSRPEGWPGLEVGWTLRRSFWGRGYATEATGALVRHAFDELGLNRLQAHHMVRNPASGRVLEKAGFRREGVLRERVYRWGRFEDVVVYGILRSDLADGA